MLELQLTVTLLILNFFNCFSKYVSSSNLSYLFTIPVDSSQIDHLHSVVISDFWSKCWLSIKQLSSKYCFSLDCPLPTFSCLHLAIQKHLCFKLSHNNQVETCVYRCGYQGICSGYQLIWGINQWRLKRARWGDLRPLITQNSPPLCSRPTIWLKKTDYKGLHKTDDKEVRKTEYKEPFKTEYIKNRAAYRFSGQG